MTEPTKLLCKCSVCGLVGKLVPYSTFTRHRRNDDEKAAKAALSTAMKSSSSARQPSANPATQPAGNTSNTTIIPPGDSAQISHRRHQRSSDLDANPEPLKRSRDAEDVPHFDQLETLDDDFNMMDVGPSEPLANNPEPDTGVHSQGPNEDEGQDSRRIIDELQAQPPEDIDRSSDEEDNPPPSNPVPHGRVPPPERIADPIVEYETDMPNFEPIMDDIKTTNDFVKLLRDASLTNSEVEPVDPDLIREIQNPRTSIPALSADEQLSIETYLAVGNASQETYTTVMAAMKRRYPDTKPLTFYMVQNLVKSLSGVFPIVRDMCVNTCVGFTEPFIKHTQCPMCGTDRFITVNRKKVPQKQFTTIPIGPSLQCLRHTEKSSLNMDYRSTFTRKILQEMAAGQVPPYRDFFSGEGYLKAYQDEVKKGQIFEDRIKDQDVCLILSIDGAQLYRNKVSDCWIYIWILLDLPPEMRYKKKHILPGGFIPGPNKPKNVDSFLFPGLYHLAALQRHGLQIWDCMKKEVVTSHPFLALVTADGPGMACICGFVGHQGKIHCRLFCPIVGRHKAGSSSYYPVMLKPNNFTVQGCDHDDVNLISLLRNHKVATTSQRYQSSLDYLSGSPNPTAYKRRRLETGLVKPTIFLGLPKDRILGVPGMFALDIMHLPCLNIPSLFIDLWRDGDKKLHDIKDNAAWDWAVLEDEAVWNEHGKMVEDARPFIPASFDRRPRNPAEKINTSYKAWEFLLYIYGLGPCLFHGLLPEKYWVHYCKLVRGYRLMLQEEILDAEVKEAHQLLAQFATEFEEIYCQRKDTRLQFVRPNIHTTAHVPSETVRLGPLIIFAQWAMERTIGNLVEEIRNHASPYANISQRGVRRCQVNALKALIPSLDDDTPKIPKGSIDVGGSYILSGKDTAMRAITEAEAEAILTYGNSKGDAMASFSRKPKVCRWAKASLPNGQKVRSEWKEKMLRMATLRCGQHIKYLDQHKQAQYGRARYFMWYPFNGVEQALAIVSQYGPPDQDLLKKSFQTYWTSCYRGEAAIKAVEVQSILAVVMMAPDLQFQKVFPHRAGEDRWYLMEKPGLKLHKYIGIVDDDEDV